MSHLPCLARKTIISPNEPIRWVPYGHIRQMDAEKLIRQIVEMENRQTRLMRALNGMITA